MDERGFTLIELLAVAVLIMGLLVLSLFLLRPDDYTVKEQTAKRRTDLAGMVQAINRYVADKGELPPNIPNKITAISSVSGHYDLCKYLVPAYAEDIPLDPLVGVKTDANMAYTQARCDTSGITYAAGYGIIKNKNGRVILSSPLSDSGTLELAVPKSNN